MSKSIDYLDYLKAKIRQQKQQYADAIESNTGVIATTDATGAPITTSTAPTDIFKGFTKFDEQTMNISKDRSGIIALENLKKVATDTIAIYVWERLTSDEMIGFNASFSAIVEELKKIAVGGVNNVTQESLLQIIRNHIAKAKLNKFHIIPVSKAQIVTDITQKRQDEVNAANQLIADKRLLQAQREQDIIDARTQEYTDAESKRIADENKRILDKLKSDKIQDLLKRRSEMVAAKAELARLKNEAIESKRLKQEAIDEEKNRKNSETSTLITKVLNAKNKISQLIAFKQQQQKEEDIAKVLQKQDEAAREKIELQRQKQLTREEVARNRNEFYDKQKLRELRANQLPVQQLDTKLNNLLQQNRAPDQVVNEQLISNEPESGEPNRVIEYMQNNNIGTIGLINNINELYGDTTPAKKSVGKAGEGEKQRFIKGLDAMGFALSNKEKDMTKKKLFDHILETKIPRNVQPVSGKGFKKRNYTTRFRHIVGRGAPQQTQELKNLQRYNYFKHDVFLIDLDKLKKNIINVKYEKNGKVIDQLRQKKISQDCSDVISDIINDKFSNKLYLLLPPAERSIIKIFVRRCKFNVQLKDPEDEATQNRFEILRGEYLAGADHPELLKELRQYVQIAIQEQQISRVEGTQMLLQLSSQIIDGQKKLKH